MSINVEKLTTKILGVMSNMAKAHQGEIHSQYIDWQIIKTVNPRYEGGIVEQLVPIVVIDFK
jgi:hypothetical protein